MQHRFLILPFITVGPKHNFHPWSKVDGCFLPNTDTRPRPIYIDTNTVNGRNPIIYRALYDIYLVVQLSSINRTSHLTLSAFVATSVGMAHLPHHLGQDRLLHFCVHHPRRISIGFLWNVQVTSLRRWSLFFKSPLEHLASTHGSPANSTPPQKKDRWHGDTFISLIVH